MKAILRSARIAPKKANLIARMVRGMPVPEALEALAHTNKKAARLIEKLLQSASANASHNGKMDPEKLVIASIIVNQGTAYRRGMPKARGQQRPFRKFLSHIEVELAYPGVEGVSEKNPKNPRKPMKPKGDAKREMMKSEEKTSQKAEKTVKASSTPKTKKNTNSSDSSDSSVSSVSFK